MMTDKEIKVAIIDDEEPARNLLREYLTQIQGVRIIGECHDGYEGVKLIHEMKPDIILLDVQMPRINGIEMLELIDEAQMPRVIFTTAYDEYAIKAFELNAADYLLKPISEDRFEQAMHRVMGEIQPTAADIKKNMKQLLDSVFQAGKQLDRIVVNSGSGIEIIPDLDIICLLANDDYIFVCTDKKDYLKNKTLRYYEERLDPKMFLRVHRSCIVNLTRIQRIEPYTKDSWMAIMKNGRRLSVSKHGYSALRNALDF